jgi:peptidyl-prolyl cis-trans isomerase-like 4
MQSVLIDDRRIHVDFSQSVSKLHKDWINKRTAGNKASMGGFDNLQKRTRYREGEDSRGEDYDLVFDTNKKDSKRHKPDDNKSSKRYDDEKKRDDGRSSRRRDDDRERKRDSDRKDDRRDYDRKRVYDRHRDRDTRRDDDRRRR